MSRDPGGVPQAGGSVAANDLEARFRDPLTVRLWRAYFTDAARAVRRLPAAQRGELLRELQSHLLASLADDPAEREPERLMNAIDRLGAPGDYLAPLVADRLLERASMTMSPAAVLAGLFHGGFRTTGRALATAAFSLGYALVVLLIAGALLKPVTPNTIGLFRGPDGRLDLSIYLSDTRTATPLGADVLGLWVVPLFVVVAVTLYAALTKLLPLLRLSPERTPS